MLLKVENLTVKFDDFVVLNNINFEIKEREIVGIIGPNGGGKTTLLKALTNQISFEGKIYLKQGAKVTLVPQIRSINRLIPLTVKELFTYSKFDFNQVSQFLKDLAKMKISNLSDGQLQKVLLIYALVQKPDLLLLDEPSTFLDPVNKENTFTLIHQFCKINPMAILLVSHDLSLISSITKRVICLNKNLICDGPLNKLTPELLEKLYGYSVAFYEHHHE